MALKTKKTKKSSSGVGAFFTTGLNSKQMREAMKSGGGGGDPELILLSDGDQVDVTFVTESDGMVTFFQHYLGKGGGYKICPGDDGCEYCDDGITRSKRTIAPVYVHMQYRAERDQYKATRQKNVGYRYLIMNQKLTDRLMARAERRGGKVTSQIWSITRDGGGTDTEYDLEGTGNPTKKETIRGNKLDAVKKITAMFKADSKGGVKKGKKRRDEDDDDYDLNEEFSDVDDDDEDEDERPRKKSKLKSKSKRRR